MRKWIIYMILALMIIPIARGIQECQAEIEPGDVPCMIVGTYVYDGDCNTYTVNIYNSTPSLEVTKTMDTYGVTGFCNVTFNYTQTGSYLFNISAAGEGGTINVVPDRMSYISIGIILIGVTILFAYFAINSKTEAFQIAFSLLALLMVVADFWFSARFLAVIDSTQTGLIHNLDTMYFIAITIFQFILFLVGVYIMWQGWELIANWKSRKRIRKEQEWMMRYS